MINAQTDPASNSQVGPGGGQWTPLPARPNPLGIMDVSGFHAQTVDFRAPPSQKYSGALPLLTFHFSLNSNPIFSESLVLNFKVTFLSTFGRQALSWEQTQFLSPRSSQSNEGCKNSTQLWASTETVRAPCIPQCLVQISTT